MKQGFEIVGLFYESNGHKCRKYLDIKRSNVQINKPDLIVVMMNPGSSRPVDGNDNNTIASQAVPDKTQEQIMEVMKNSKFNYARILNLSDLREPKSEIFYSKIKDLQNTSHSIFSDLRLDDFKSLFVSDVPVIYAWGVNTKLKYFADTAINRININNPIGILKEGTKSAYYHPLPQNYNAQEQWCKEITRMLNEHT